MKLYCPAAYRAESEVHLIAMGNDLPAIFEICGTDAHILTVIMMKIKQNRGGAEYINTVYSTPRFY